MKSLQAGVRISLRDSVLAAAAALLFAVTFLPWVRGCAAVGDGTLDLVSCSTSTAWDSSFGTVASLAAVAVLVAVALTADAGAVALACVVAAALAAAVGLTNEDAPLRPGRAGLGFWLWLFDAAVLATVAALSLPGPRAGLRPVAPPRDPAVWTFVAAAAAAVTQLWLPWLDGPGSGGTTLTTPVAVGVTLAVSAAALGLAGRSSKPLVPLLALVGGLGLAVGFLATLREAMRVPGWDLGSGAWTALGAAVVLLGGGALGVWTLRRGA